MTSDIPGDLTVVTMGILWFSAVASAIVDNIPYAATATRYGLGVVVVSLVISTFHLWVRYL